MDYSAIENGLFHETQCLVDDSEECIPYNGSVCEGCFAIYLKKEAYHQSMQHQLLHEFRRGIRKGQVTCSLCLKPKECYHQISICIRCYGTYSKGN